MSWIVDCSLEAGRLLWTRCTADRGGSVFKAGGIVNDARPGGVARHALEVRQDDLSGEATRALLRLHLAGMHANSPPGSVFALDLTGLEAPEVSVWTAWLDGVVVGIAALKALGDGTGEIKSMRTHPGYLRQGVAAVLLEHIIEVARTRGMGRLSLETGSGPAFEPALALYRRRGFVQGAAFAQYRRSEFNQFLHLEL
jgi:putative acetyltransferase